MSKSNRIGAINDLSSIRYQKKRFNLAWWLLAPFLFLIFFPVEIHSDITSYTLERQKWMGQLGTNPIPFFYQFDAQVAGIGMKEVRLISPGATNVLTGNTVYMSYSTNYSLNWTSLPPVAASTTFNTNFPIGTYQWIDIAQVQTRTRTNTTTLQWTADFPAINPVITNIAPYQALQSTQAFQWPVFTTNSDSYVRFMLFEGQFDTNMIVSLLEGDLTGLTNLALAASEPRLAPSKNTVTVSGLKPELDHLALLEFNQVEKPGGLANTLVSSSGNLVLYYSAQARLLSQPHSLTVSSGMSAVFAVVASGSLPLQFQWQFNGIDLPGATNATLTLSPVTLEHAGEYRVVVSNSINSVLSQSATLTVTADSTEPVLTALDYEEGSLQVRVDGEEGAEYQFLISTNLVDWQEAYSFTNQTGLSTNSASQSSRRQASRSSSYHTLRPSDLFDTNSTSPVTSLMLKLRLRSNRPALTQ